MQRPCHKKMLQISQTKPCHSFHRNPVHYPFIELDAFVVMPNHVHGIMVINRFIEKPIVEALHATPLPQNDAAHQLDETMSFISSKSGSLSVVVQ
jgi:putative transposase